MLCLVGVLLSCGVLCIASPLPPTTGASCAVTSLIQETLKDIQTLKSEGSSKIMPLNMTEQGGNITTYLEGFIKALRSSEERPKETLIAQKLQTIQDAVRSCLTRMEQDWWLIEEEDFFSNLDHLLRFLNQNVLPE